MLVLRSVNDLLGLLSGFGGDGSDGSDVNGDGSVDVNDLLALLSDFGSTCEPGGGGGGDAPPACVIEQIMPFMDPATGDLTDLPGLAALLCSEPPSLDTSTCSEVELADVAEARGSICGTGDEPCSAEMGACIQNAECAAFLTNGEDEFDIATCMANAHCGAMMQCQMDNSGPPCSQGDDCGGQVWNDCGSMCPPTCGVQMGMACPDMCVAEFQCPMGQMWDPAGSCVESADCSVVWSGELPPMAPGGGGGGGGEIGGRPAVTCQVGEDCGGQVWNDCGSMCPLICGQMIGMCNM